MEANEPTQWFDHQIDDGVLILSIKLSEEGEFFDNPDQIVAEVLSAYGAATASVENPSCVVVIEAEIATSPLLRLLYLLYRECQKKRGGLYVCNFPQEDMISLNTLGLTEYPGFHLKPSRQDAVAAARSLKQD
jgi:hypothetical protein